MSVMIAEGASTAAAGSGAAAGTGAGARAAGSGTRAPRNVSRGTRSGTKRKTPTKRTTQGPARQTSGTPSPARSTSSRPKQRSESPADDEAARTWRQRTAEAPPPTSFVTGGSGATYRRIILAEFAACVLLVGASPFLKPRSKDQTAAEVAAQLTLAQPMARLTAVCITFFILALLSNGPRSGRIAAAFGGLVTVGTLVNATDVATGLTMMFGPSTQTPATAPSPGAVAGQVPGSVPGEVPGVVAGRAPGSISGPVLSVVPGQVTAKVPGYAGNAGQLG